MKFEAYLEEVLPADTTFEQVKQVLDGRGWTWVQRIPAAEGQFLEEIWLVDGNRGAVRYIRDHFLDVSILRAESNVDLMVGGILNELEPLLHTFRLLTLMKMGDAADPRERAFALCGMAAIGERFYAGIFNALKSAAGDPDPRFRELAVRCISRYPWFQFIKVLQEVSARETVPELRESQLALIDGIRQHGKRGI
ncbi:hypothetical protein JGU66_18480 [Myxococcaceae bacterium JPH2]|nr:hypothetical protein [Myxococcaceae bacterium JPH2]